MKYGIINIIALVCFRSAIFHLALPLSLCACTLIFSSYSNNHVWSFNATVLVCVPQLLYRAQTHVPQNTTQYERIKDLFDITVSNYYVYYIARAYYSCTLYAAGDEETEGGERENDRTSE